jgi:6-phosphogluconate dehydrogenase
MMFASTQETYLTEKVNSILIQAAKINISIPSINAPIYFFVTHRTKFHLSHNLTETEQTRERYPHHLSCSYCCPQNSSHPSAIFSVYKRLDG